MQPDAGGLDLSLGPEWAVLEFLCCAGETADREPLDALLEREDLDWGDLLEQALRHQTLPLLAHRVLSGRAAEQLPVYLSDHLSSVLDLNRRRLEVLRQAALEIAGALAAAKVPCVATKGITFESTIYRGQGTRKLKDVDFMIAPDSRERVVEIVEGLGYVAGNFDWQNGRVVPHLRRDRMRYLLHPDHLPRYARATGGRLIRHVYLDFANSLTWSKSPYQLPVEVALASARLQPVPGVDGGSLPCFSPVFQFVFTALHLFREAWLENWVGLGIDVSLMKFGDVLRLFAHDGDVLRAELGDTLERHEVVEPVAWVLEHLDRTFGTELIAELGWVGRIDESWLAAAHPARGRERRWTGTMRQRLFNKDRRQLFVVAGEQAGEGASS